MACAASALMNTNERNLKTLTALYPMMITFLAGAVNRVFIRFYAVLICVIGSSFFTQPSKLAQALSSIAEITKCCNEDDHTGAFIGVQVNLPNMTACSQELTRFTVQSALLRVN
ncbi:hypothetical protein B6E78_09695 [Edwardsiella ictaluri]|nr:hypothetical protein B6E78_09695 [Edwardsiella ictaluri]